MPFAAVIYFNEQTEKTIRDIWKSLNSPLLAPAMDEKGIRPHLTLAIYDQLECCSCQKALGYLKKQIHTINLNFTYFGIFHYSNPIVFMAPPLEKQLKNIHEQIHDCLQKRGSGPWEIYLHDNWVPHCTLAMDFNKEQLPAVMERCLQLSLPIKTPAVQIGIVEFDPIQPVFEIDLPS